MKLPPHLVESAREDASLASLAASLEELMRFLTGPDATGEMPEPDSDLARWMRKVWAMSPRWACRMMLTSVPLKRTYVTVPSRVQASWRRMFRLLRVLDAERGDSAAPIGPDDVVDDELHDWLNTARRKWAEGTLPLAQEIILRAHGVDLGWPDRETFSLSPSSARRRRDEFTEKLAKVVAWQAEHGVSQDASEELNRLDPELHSWLASVSGSYDAYATFAAQDRQIEKSGIDLRTSKDWRLEYARQRRLDAVKAIALHIERHGSAIIRGGAVWGRPPLPYGTYAASWRQEYAAETLDPEIQGWLEAVQGWTWDIPPQGKQKRWHP